VYGKHKTILLDTSVPNLDESLIGNIKKALKVAFDRYLLDQDQITVIGFSDKEHSTIILDKVKCSQRDRIFSAIDQLKFIVGCADWSAGLSLLNPTLQEVYFITDENPCGTTNPTHIIRTLQAEGVDITAIGIGPKVDRKWLQTLSNRVHMIPSYNYLLHKKITSAKQRKDNKKRHPSVSDPAPPLTGGEITAVVLISVLILSLIIVSLVYACRENQVHLELSGRRMKIKQRF